MWFSGLSPAPEFWNVNQGYEVGFKYEMKKADKNVFIRDFCYYYYFSVKTIVYFANLAILVGMFKQYYCLSVFSCVSMWIIFKVSLGNLMALAIAVLWLVYSFVAKTAGRTEFLKTHIWKFWQQACL